MTDQVTPVETPPETPSVPPVENVSDALQGETPADPPAAPAEPDSETPDNGETPPEGARKSRAQERIEELAQTNKYLREHNEFLRDALSKGLKTPAEAPAPAPPAPVAEEVEEEPPTLEACAFDTTKHAAETAKWVKKAVARGVQQALTAEKTQVETQTEEQAIVTAANEFRKDHPDFDVLLANPKLQFTPTVMDALKAAGADSPALGYYLAQNPDKLATIARMKPQQQLMRLGEIKATLVPAPKPAKTPAPPAPVPPKAPVTKKPATTNAPPPPTPVSGAATPDVDPMTLSGTEWAKWRRQQLAAKRGTTNKPVVRHF